jgi:hypothetical protein
MDTKTSASERRLLSRFWARLDALDMERSYFSDVRHDMQQAGLPEHDEIDKLLGDIHLASARLRAVGFRMTRRMAGKPEPPEMEY